MWRQALLLLAVFAAAATAQQVPSDEAQLKHGVDPNTGRPFGSPGLDAQSWTPEQKREWYKNWKKSQRQQAKQALQAQQAKDEV